MNVEASLHPNSRIQAYSEYLMYTSPCSLNNIRVSVWAHAVVRVRSGSPDWSEGRTFRVVFQFAVSARSSTKPKPRPPRIRRNPIFLAREWHGALETGEVSSRAELARKLGVSRARVTQLLKLRKMTPEVLKAIEALGDPMPSPIVSERKLRTIVNLPPCEQTHRVAAMLTTTASGRSNRLLKTPH